LRRAKNAVAALEPKDADSPTLKISALDKLTSGGDYVSDILHRRAEYLAMKQSPPP
jgi:hypothetical protein